MLNLFVLDYVYIVCKVFLHVAALLRNEINSVTGFSQQLDNLILTQLKTLSSRPRTFFLLFASSHFWNWNLLIISHDVKPSRRKHLLFSLMSSLIMCLTFNFHSCLTNGTRSDGKKKSWCKCLSTSTCYISPRWLLSTGSNWKLAPGSVCVRLLECACVNEHAGCIRAPVCVCVCTCACGDVLFCHVWACASASISMYLHACVCCWSSPFLCCHCSSISKCYWIYLFRYM